MYDLKKPQLAMPYGEALQFLDESHSFFHHVITVIKEDSREESFVNGKVIRLYPNTTQAQGELDFVTLSDEIFVVLDRAMFFNRRGLKLIDSEWTRFHFRLDADTTLLFGKLGQADLKGPLCNVIHLPEGMVEGEWYNETPSMGWVTIFCSRTCILHLLDNDTTHLPKALKRYLNSGRPDWIFDVLPLSVSMARCIHEIPQIPYTTPLGLIHLEAKVIELLCMFLYNLSHQGKEQRLPVVLRSNDINCLHEARRILMNEFVAPPSVENLSKNIGINRKKLTYGFKHMFRQTVSEFIFEQKMLAAQDLLTQNDLSIDQVATAVGYDHAGNFSTAFKRYFGVPPRNSKK